MFQAAFYKGKKTGINGIYNRATKIIERGPYSHGELVFSDGVAASSSFMDKGVRFKEGIEFTPEKWDLIRLPDRLEQPARKWFVENEGADYDLIGQFHFLIFPAGADNGDFWCTEAMAAALGYPDPWRYGPNGLASALYGAYRNFRE